MNRKIKEIEDIAKLDIFRDKRCGIPGLVAVNIDNGFGAACAAVLIAKQSKNRKEG